MNKKPDNKTLCDNVVRRVTNSWHDLRAAQTIKNGKTRLPATLPSKDECISPLMSLPSHPHRHDVSDAAAAFQFRKCLPAVFDKDKAAELTFQKLTRPSPPPTPEALKALREASRLLPRGWDKDYQRQVQLATPHFSGNLEKVVPDDTSLYDVEEFRERCLGHRPIQIPAGRKVIVLDDCGKARVPTLASYLQLHLAPLHHTLYDALVRHGPVLRGSPDPANLAAFTTSPPLSPDPQVFVSGDYDDATNEFNSHLTVASIDLLAARSTHIPKSVWQAARQFMSTADLIYKNGGFEMAGTKTSGQLMGDYLSFPLLCFINIAGLFRALGEKRVRQLIKDKLVKVNGDDIVFRCTRQEYETWATTCLEMGLKVSRTKTLVHRAVFTINSNFFYARQTCRPRHIWFWKAKSFVINTRDKTAKKKKSQREKVKARFSALTDVLAMTLSGVTDPARRAALRMHVLKRRESWVEGASLHEEVPDAEEYKKFPPMVRRYMKANIKSRSYGPSRHNAAVEYAKLDETFHRTAKKPSTKDAKAEHRDLTQRLAFNRKRIENPEDSTPVYYAHMWETPDSLTLLPEKKLQYPKTANDDEVKTFEYPKEYKFVDTESGEVKRTLKPIQEKDGQSRRNPWAEDGPFQKVMFRAAKWWKYVTEGPMKYRAQPRLGLGCTWEEEVWLRRGEETEARRPTPVFVASSK